MQIRTIVADYSDTQHADNIVFLLNCYALDPMGGSSGLTDEVKNNLVGRLAAIRGAFSVLGYMDDKPAGLVNCFEGFSTFKCKPVLNIHDVIVTRESRGLGICPQMLRLVEEHARDRGCCKLTLEVLEGNAAAKEAYTNFGFTGYELDPDLGKALFWEKLL